MQSGYQWHPACSAVPHDREVPAGAEDCRYAPRRAESDDDSRRGDGGDRAYTLEGGHRHGIVQWPDDLGVPARSSRRGTGLAGWQRWVSVGDFAQTPGQIPLPTMSRRGVRGEAITAFATGSRNDARAWGPRMRPEP